MRWKTTAGNGTTGYTFLVLLSSLTNLEGHKNNVCDLTVWHPLKNSTLCFLNTLLSIMLSTLTACVSFLLFLRTTYCVQHDSGYTVYGASPDIGRLFFKTNAKWKGSITLQLPDRWCINSLSLYWVVYRSREKKETRSVVDCGRWRSVFVCCVLTVTIILCCWQPQLCGTVGHISGLTAAAGRVVILTFHF